VLAAPRQHAVPEPAHLESERQQCRSVHGHPEVPLVPLNHRAQPLTYLRDGIMHAPPQLSFHFAQLRLHPLPTCLPQHGEAPVAPLPRTDVREAEEIECLRLPLTPLLAVPGRIASKLHEPRLLGMQLQAELPQPL